MPISGDIEPVIFTASTNGRPSAIVATASPGDTIHTAAAGTTSIDYVTVYASNIDTVTRTITLQWGGTSTSDQLGPLSISANSGLVLVAPAIPIQNGLAIKAYTDSASKVNVVVRVARGTV